MVVVLFVCLRSALSIPFRSSAVVRQKSQKAVRHTEHQSRTSFSAPDAYVEYLMKSSALLAHNPFLFFNPRDLPTGGTSPSAWNEHVRQRWTARLSTKVEHLSTSRVLAGEGAQLAGTYGQPGAGSGSASFLFAALPMPGDDHDCRNRKAAGGAWHVVRVRRMCVFEDMYYLSGVGPAEQKAALWVEEEDHGRAEEEGGTNNSEEEGCCGCVGKAKVRNMLSGTILSRRKNKSSLGLDDEVPRVPYGVRNGDHWIRTLHRYPGEAVISIPAGKIRSAVLGILVGSNPSEADVIRARLLQDLLMDDAAPGKAGVGVVGPRKPIFSLSSDRKRLERLSLD